MAIRKREEEEKRKKKNMEGSCTPLYIILHLSSDAPADGSTSHIYTLSSEARAGAAGIPLLVEFKPAGAVTARGLEQ